MFWMQPVSLLRKLDACGIEEPWTSGWKLWRARGASVERAYFLRLIFVLSTAPLSMGLALATLHFAGLRATIGRIVIIVAFNVAICAPGIIMGVIRGMAYGMAFGAAF